MRLKAGQIIECYLSTKTLSFASHEHNVKKLVRAVVDGFETKNDAHVRLAVGLLEALFRHGPDICRITVEHGGLDCLIETCKTQMDVSMSIIRDCARSSFFVLNGAVFMPKAVISMPT